MISAVLSAADFLVQCPEVLPEKLRLHARTRSLFEAGCPDGISVERWDAAEEKPKAFWETSSAS